jgi:nucleoside-diphosphate-sugar epimerase
MTRALVVGGTRFIGRHTVDELLAHGDDVTIFNRGRHPNPFATDDRVTHVEGDRTDDGALERARDVAAPEIVIDCVALRPDDVRTATDVFADADAYVYVSTGAVYADHRLPIREDAALEAWAPDVEDDDPHEAYGPRKAEGDRAVFAAAADGVAAMSVRPMQVYGPHDYTGRFDYWVHRVDRFDRILVPGDGGSLFHRSYVEDVAAGLRLVAESGTPGEAYNVADRTLMTLKDSVELIAEALDTDVEVVTASERELSAHGLAPSEFPQYTPDPMIVGTEKLADLGWESTPRADAVAAHAEDYLDSDRDGTAHGPDREAERRAIEALTE